MKLRVHRRGDRLHSTILNDVAAERVPCKHDVAANVVICPEGLRIGVADEACRRAVRKVDADDAWERAGECVLVIGATRAIGSAAVHCWRVAGCT